MNNVTKGVLRGTQCIPLVPEMRGEREKALIDMDRVRKSHVRGGQKTKKESWKTGGREGGEGCRG